MHDHGVDPQITFTYESVFQDFKSGIYGIFLGDVKLELECEEWTISRISAQKLYKDLIIFSSE